MSEPAHRPPLQDLAQGLDRVLARLNEMRRAARRSREWSVLEETVEGLFSPSRHLAVYGTLAPGAPNHSVIAEVRGEWRTGAVRGELSPRGWGALQGYPSLRWDPEGDEIPVQLLVSDQLGHEWDRLDEFEGPGYVRVLVPVRSGEKLVAVANCYEGRAERPVSRDRRSPARGRRR